MSSIFKNCPKCDSEEVYEEGDEQWSQVECSDCGYHIKRKDYDKCVNAWNKLKREEHNDK